MTLTMVTKPPAATFKCRLVLCMRCALLELNLTTQQRRERIQRSWHCRRQLTQQPLCVLEIKISLNIMLILQCAQRTDTDGSPLFRELHADNFNYFRWNKVPSWRPNADCDWPGWGHPILRLIAGQLAYILQKRVTDSRCFISDVETVE